MDYNHGKLLNKGDTVGLTAPAGPVKADKLEAAINVIKEMGFEVEIGQTCFVNYGGYLAGPPELRARELNAMFANPNISAIFCLRGGYGSPQLLHMLDYELIFRHPKLFIGYSDITALHIALQQQSKLATIHGPMPASDLIEADEFTKANLQNVLMHPRQLRVMKNPGEKQIGCLVPGFAQGILTGGNLTLITSLLGTPYEIETNGKILFLEDIAEEPYKIDRMLTQLALAGKFSDVAGIILGTWTNCTSKEGQESFQVEDLFEKIIAPYNKPTIYNVQAGHCKPALTLPFGEVAYVDATNKTFLLGV
ncbi:MAG TPA: LD-carboxypeptidase [Bacillaceae bacterium]|nr:LD-carboxypeptidase [Paenibacillus bovis]HLU22335.1 LD-carboxypeptidase [Bacillaceae bacterium]